MMRLIDILRKTALLSGMLLVLAGGLFVAPGLTSAAEENAIGLQRDILIDGPVVRLSDIFYGLDPNSRTAGTPIAKAPSPGKVVELNATWLAAVAKAYGIAWQPRSNLDTARLQRTSYSVEVAEMRSLIEETLAEQGLEGKIRIALDQTNPRLLLPSDVDGGIAIANFTFDKRSGRFFAQIVAPAKGAAAGRINLTGVARTMTEVPVLAHRIGYGEVIGEEDLEWIEIEERDISRNAVLDMQDIVGMSLRRAVAPGRLIRAGDLRLPVVVSKNSLVTIELVTSGMYLTTQGRALENGAKGEAIRVTNLQSNQIVTALVRDRDTVAIATPQLGQRTN